MSNIRNCPSIAVLAVLFPILAVADLSQTTTLSANTALNLDTGATASSGGDILWTGTSITVQGYAKDLNITAVLAGLSGISGFNGLTLQILQAGAGLASTAAINSPAQNTIIGVVTNGGNFAKILVTAVSGSSITLQYTTYGASGAPTGPSITKVQNNYSYILPGLPNYGIAQGSIFDIFGVNLADPGPAVLQSSAAPGIPVSLNGASVSVTVNGVTTHPGLYFAIPTQLAVVLPSNTPAGSGTITVTYNGTTSSPAAIQVVQSALGVLTADGSGTGRGKATNPSTGALYNYNASAAPGETVVLWGSGLGANTADSDTVYTPSPHGVNVPLQIYIGGIQASIGYQGGSGYPGLNQINVTIPPSVQPGCAVSVVAVSGSVVSNTVTLPIQAGGGACSDPTLGSDGSQILALGGKTTYKVGSFTLLQSTSGGQTHSFATGSFFNVPGAQAAYGLVSIGSCIVNSFVTSGSPSVSTTTGLDAGNVSVTGPTGTQQLPLSPNASGSGPSGMYSAMLPGGFVPAAGGAFTFIGTGGANVGSFSANVSFTNPLSWTNMNAIASINRSQGVTVNWSGGAPNTYVFIAGSSSAPGVSVSFICNAPVSANQFTIPSYVLLALPAGNGSLLVQNNTNPQSFSASGLDSAQAFAAVGFSISPSYQ